MRKQLFSVLALSLSFAAFAAAQNAAQQAAQAAQQANQMAMQQAQAANEAAIRQAQLASQQASQQAQQNAANTTNTIYLPLAPGKPSISFTSGKYSNPRPVRPKTLPL